MFCIEQLENEHFEISINRFILESIQKNIFHRISVQYNIDQVYMCLSTIQIGNEMLNFIVLSQKCGISCFLCVNQLKIIENV